MSDLDDDVVMKRGKKVDILFVNNIGGFWLWGKDLYVDSVKYFV